MAAAPGSFPSLNLVEISRADAALTQTAVSGSPIAARARRESRFSPASHQSSACVSRRSFTASALPGLEFLLGQRIVEALVDERLAAQGTESPLGGCLLDRDQPDDGLLAAADDDLLPGTGPLDQ